MTKSRTALSVKIMVATRYVASSLFVWFDSFQPKIVGLKDFDKEHQVEDRLFKNVIAHLFERTFSHHGLVFKKHQQQVLSLYQCVGMAVRTKNDMLSGLDECLFCFTLLDQSVSSQAKAFSKTF